MKRPNVSRKTSGGGLMRSLRQGTKSMVSAKGATKKSMTFWDVLFWLAAGGALLLFVFRRLS